jgi:hypothetical protein
VLLGWQRHRELGCGGLVGALRQRLAEQRDPDQDQEDELAGRDGRGDHRRGAPGPDGVEGGQRVGVLHRAGRIRSGREPSFFARCNAFGANDQIIGPDFLGEYAAAPGQG